MAVRQKRVAEWECRPHKGKLSQFAIPILIDRSDAKPVSDFSPDSCLQSFRFSATTSLES